MRKVFGSILPPSTFPDTDLFRINKPEADGISVDLHHRLSSEFSKTTYIAASRLNPSPTKIKHPTLESLIHLSPVVGDAEHYPLGRNLLAPRLAGQFAIGQLTLPRAESIIEYLGDQLGTDRLRISDNGFGMYAQLSATLAYKGHDVTMIEPCKLSNNALSRIFKLGDRSNHFGHITHLDNIDDINCPREVDLAIWSHPTPAMDQFGVHHSNHFQYRDSYRMGEYLGRDVIVGGYLMIQTDFDRYMNLPFDPLRWEWVLKTMIPRCPDTDSCIVIPTSFTEIKNMLMILKRKA